MSIIPRSNDADHRLLLPSLFDHFLDPPFPFSRAFPSSRNSHVDWSETPRAHVITGSFSGEDVLVELVDDDRALQISTETGSFSARFAVPGDARLDGLRVSMDGGVLTVTIPKEESPTTPRSSSVRVVEITGDD